jgi:hypothetical protein
VRAARTVAEAIGTEDTVLAGGLAVMAYGFVRGTRDLDLLTRVPLSEARARLQRKGIPTRLLKGDPVAGGFSCLKGECEGLPFDVLPELVPLHWEAAVTVGARDSGALRVVSLADLLALKLRAQGAKDLMDAATLVLMHPEMEPRARQLAVAYRTLDRLEAWLADARTRAQAAEELGHESKQSASKRPAKRQRGRQRS